MQVKSRLRFWDVLREKSLTSSSKLLAATATNVSVDVPKHTSRGVISKQQALSRITFLAGQIWRYRNDPQMTPAMKLALLERKRSLQTAISLNGSGIHHWYHRPLEQHRKASTVRSLNPEKLISHNNEHITFVSASKTVTDSTNATSFPLVTAYHANAKFGCGTTLELTVTSVYNNIW